MQENVIYSYKWALLNNIINFKENMSGDRLGCTNQKMLKKLHLILCTILNFPLKN